MSRFFVVQEMADEKFYAHFIRDEDGNASGRVDWVGTQEEATPFDSLSECAEVVEYHHINGYEIETG